MIEVESASPCTEDQEESDVEGGEGEEPEAPFDCKKRSKQMTSGP